MNSPFDEAKYQALLKGLSAEEIMVSEAEDHKDFRLEPDFYTAPTLFKGPSYLGKEAIDFVQYGTSDQLNEDAIGYPTLRLNEINTGFVEEPSKFCASMGEAEFESLLIRKGDVLVCRTNGNPRLVGKSAIAMEDTEFAFASYLFKVQPDPSKISPETLCIFLNCKVGRAEIEKHSIRSNQVNFSPDKIKQIQIPQFGSGFMGEIDQAVLNSYKAQEDSKNLYAQAETLLIRALDLENWRAPVINNYTARSGSVWDAARLDAEHFHPQYQAMLDHVKVHAKRCRLVQDFATQCGRGTQPIYDAEGTLAVVNSKHILENGLDYDNFERTDAAMWNAKDFLDARIQRGDVLTYTTGAKIGRTGVYLSDERALASNHVNLTRIEGENPIYVAVALNSMIGRMQTRRDCTGSAQVELYPSDIRQFMVPFVAPEIESEIVACVEGSHDAKRRAKALLERAKRAVEVAIEEDEAAGLLILEGE